jgi:MHS family alpha-ketoglutarate permease-like MFS transporter
MIAVTPGYATIGLAAPVLLVLARLLQGLSVGGEYGASATYLSEMAGQRYRGFFSSFQYVTLISGQLIALAVLLLLQSFLGASALDNWAWRLPFAFGATLAVVALWVRRGLEETPSFRATTQDGTTANHATLRELLRYPRQIFTVVGLTAGGTVAFYTFTTYAQKFLVNSAGWSKGDASRISAVSLLVFMLIQPVVGFISDRIGRRPVLISFGILGLFGTVPLLGALANAHTEPTAYALLISALVAVSGYTAINAVVKAELFPTEIRALGVALPYAVTVSIFGGTAEYLALWAKSIGHESWYYWYVTACIAFSLVVYATMPETSTSGRMADD